MGNHVHHECCRTSLRSGFHQRRLKCKEELSCGRWYSGSKLPVTMTVRLYVTWHFVYRRTLWKMLENFLYIADILNFFYLSVVGLFTSLILWFCSSDRCLSFDEGFFKLSTEPFSSVRDISFLSYAWKTVLYKMILYLTDCFLWIPCQGLIEYWISFLQFFNK